MDDAKGTPSRLTTVIQHGKLHQHGLYNTAMVHMTSNHHYVNLVCLLDFLLGVLLTMYQLVHKSEANKAPSNIGGPTSLVLTGVFRHMIYAMFTRIWVGRIHYKVMCGG